MKFAKKNFRSPDTSRDCGHGTLEIVNLDDETLARITLQPGWRWSDHIRPMVNTESCQAHHTQFVISGRLKIVMDDGSESELEPGDFASIPPGHDAWVLGNKPFVCIDLSPDMMQYAEEGGECRR
jgi:quercetin dioxygenase-like cupin family protein